MMEATCPVCSSQRIIDVAVTGSVPVFCNQLCRTRADAVAAPRAPVKLVYCEDCGHVHNVAFDERLIRYSPEYENSLHCSAHFQAFAEELASELVRRHRLTGKKVVEVGCGNGEFLRLLCEHGANQGFGFDMSYPGDGRELPKNISIAATPYGPEHRHLGPDLVCTRHVLEHVARPVTFLREIRESISTGAALYVEVPNALYTLRDGGVWDIIYEHCGYFTPDSLRTALESAGFVVELMQEAFDGQFLCAHAQAAPERPPVSRRAPDPELRRVVSEFMCAHASKTSAWRSSLAELAVQQRRVVAWGAGSKGNTFANVVAQAEIMPYVVDLNPRKHGMFVAGTGARIVPPEFLAQYRPDVVVVLNPNYEEEIRQRLEGLGLRPTIMVA
jgi:SAM-dependent methyltransferase